MRGRILAMPASALQFLRMPWDSTPRLSRRFPANNYDEGRKIALTDLQSTNLGELMKRNLLCVAVLALYLLHQDFWFWRSAQPFFFGFLPVGLFYHICYTLAVVALMLTLVKYAWPSELESPERGED